MSRRSHGDVTEMYAARSVKQAAEPHEGRQPREDRGGRRPKVASKREQRKLACYAEREQARRSQHEGDSPRVPLQAHLRCKHTQKSLPQESGAAQCACGASGCEG